MCVLLNEKETTGEAKQIQLKKWKRYFEFEKAGQKFIIGKIRERPLPKTVRKGSVYAEKIERLMQHNFSGKKDGTWVVTSKELYVALRMTSPHFRELDDNENITYFVEKLHVSGLSVVDFRGRVKVELSRILHDALGSMNKRGVMKWGKKYHISMGTENFVADQEQAGMIEAVQRQVMNELGCKRKEDIYMKNQQKQYYEHVAQKLKENYNWDKVYLYHHFEFEPRERPFSNKSYVFCAITSDGRISNSILAAGTDVCEILPTTSDVVMSVDAMQKGDSINFNSGTVLGNDLRIYGVEAYFENVETGETFQPAVWDSGYVWSDGIDLSPFDLSTFEPYTLMSDEEPGKYRICVDANCYGNVLVTIPTNTYVMIEEQQVSDDTLPESDHPYANNTDKTWEYIHPEPAEALVIQFSSETKFEQNYDTLTIIDSTGAEKQYTGTELAGAELTLPGNTFSLHLNTDNSVQEYGFKITSIITAVIVEDPDPDIPLPIPELDMSDATLDQNTYRTGETITISGIRVRNADYVHFSGNNGYLSTADICITNDSSWQSLENVKLTLPDYAVEGDFYISVQPFDDKGTEGDIDTTTLTYKVQNVNLPVPSITEVEYSGKDEVRIEWTEAEDIDGVYLYRSTSSDFTTDVIKATIYNYRNFYVDSGLVGGTTYYYRLQAFVNDEEGAVITSDFSDVWTHLFVIENPMEGYPTIISVDTIDSYSLKINWTQVVGAEGYRIWRENVATGEGEYLDDVIGGTVCSYTDMELEPNTTYAYTVTAYAHAVTENAIYISLDSNTVEGTTSEEIIVPPTCDHSDTSRLQMGQAFYNQIDGDDEMHQVEKHYSVICDTCGETINSDLEELTTEEHSFDQSGVCAKCQYQLEIECDHADTNRIQVGNPSYKQIAGDNEIHQIITCYVEQCDLCGAIVEEGISETTSEMHTFDTEGVCEICGYEKCLHTETIKEYVKTTYAQISGNVSQHQVTNYYKLVCDNCSEVTDSNYIEKLQADHTFDNSNKCTLCGYVKPQETVKIVAPVLIHPTLSTDEDILPAYTEDDMTIVWGHVEGAVKYTVFMEEYYDGDWDVIIDEEETTEESFIISEGDLWLGGIFRVCITAYGGDGDSDYSEDYYFRIGSARYIGLSEEEIQLDYEGDEDYFNVYTSENWEADVSDESWIELSQYDGFATTYLSVEVAENEDDFPRTGTIVFTNEAGGYALLTVTQEGNGSSNEGKLRIDYPKQGETVEYDRIDVEWTDYTRTGTYKVKLYDLTSNRTVIDKTTKGDVYNIYKSELSQGHIYQLTVIAYNSVSNIDMAQGSITFQVKGNGSGGTVDPDDEVIETPEVPEGSTKLELTGITNNSKVDLKDIVVTWNDIIGKDYYAVAMRDITPGGDNELVIDETTRDLEYTIPRSKLVYGHKYRLWVGAHKNGITDAITGVQVEFTVENAPLKWTANMSGESTIVVNVLEGTPDANTPYLFIAEDSDGLHYPGNSTPNIAAGATNATFKIKNLQMKRAKVYDLYVLPAGVSLTDDNRSQYRLEEKIVVPLWSGNMIYNVYSGNTDVTSTKKLYKDEDIKVVWEASYGVYNVEVSAKLNGQVVFTETYTDPKLIDGDDPVTTTIDSSKFGDAKVGDKLVITITVIPTDEAQAVLAGAGFEPTASKSWREGTFTEEYPAYYKFDNMGTKKPVENGVLEVDNTQVDNIQIYAGEHHPSDNNGNTPYYFKIDDEDVLSVENPHSFNSKVGNTGTCTVEIWNEDTDMMVASVVVIVTGIDDPSSLTRYSLYIDDPYFYPDGLVIPNISSLTSGNSFFIAERGTYHAVKLIDNTIGQQIAYGNVKDLTWDISPQNGDTIDKYGTLCLNSKRGIIYLNLRYRGVIIDKIVIYITDENARIVTADIYKRMPNEAIDFSPESRVVKQTFSELDNGRIQYDATYYNDSAADYGVVSFDKNGKSNDFDIVNGEWEDASFVDGIAQLAGWIKDIYTYISDSTSRSPGTSDTFNNPTKISVEVPAGGYVLFLNSNESTVVLNRNIAFIIAGLLDFGGDVCDLFVTKEKLAENDDVVLAIVEWLEDEGNSVSREIVKIIVTPTIEQDWTKLIADIWNAITSDSSAYNQLLETIDKTLGINSDNAGSLIKNLAKDGENVLLSGWPLTYYLMNGLDAVCSGTSMAKSIITLHTQFSENYTWLNRGICIIFPNP